MDHLPHRRLIGILGGMGPAATIDFMSKVAGATPAGFDQEHIPLIVHNVPQIPDRSAAIISRSDAPFLPMLAGIRMLERSGVDYVAIPCNTAHYWHNRLARACSATIIHIADAVAAMIALSPRPINRMALLATRGTITAEIYQRRLGDTVEFIIPPEPVQQRIDQAILLVKGNRTAEATASLVSVAEEMLAAGADKLLLACTELPVAFAGLPHASHGVDATDALARACVAVSLGPERDLRDLHLPRITSWTSAGSRIF